MGLFGGKKPKMDVTEYSLSVHFGVCTGPVDAITRVVIDDKDAWTGNLTAAGTIGINKPYLFGGRKKQGGAVGRVHYLPGGSDQVLSAELASKIGLSPDTAPGFRGMSSVWFTGNSGGGFVWQHNNPTIPPIAIGARRAPRGLDPATAMIGPDANPAHMIYECMTNTDWGMGESPGVFDVTSFNNAANTLFAESFGLTMLFTQSAEMNSFINEIINHIQATTYVDPRTGLWTIKLLRNDYDVDELPSFDDDNAVITSYQRRAYGETANEIVVSWTNPATEETETVAAQDLAGIVAQGGRVISDARDYFGVRTQALAGQLAIRDLRSASLPLASVEAEVNRDGWDITPGSVVKMSSEEHGFTDVVFRVMKINYGRIDSGKIRMSLVEDVFGLNFDSYFEVMESQWADPSGPPVDMPYQVPLTAPYFMIPYFAEELPPAPDYTTAQLASASGSDTFEYDYAVQALGPNGTLGYEAQSTRSTVARGVTLEDLPAEAETLFAIPNMSPGEAPLAGSFVLFQGTDETEHEFALVVTPNEDGTAWDLKRGVLDTVPRAWPAGTPCWIFSEGTAMGDDEPRTAGTPINYKLLSRTSQGTLPEENATAHSYTPFARPDLPLRPANVAINGVSFGEVDARGVPDIIAEWSNRNRLTETEVLLPWNTPGVTPEVGQTTTLEVLDLEGTLVNTIDNISGESYTFDSYDFAGLGLCYVRFVSKRDGLVSLQGHRLLVRRLSGGWGYSWGYAWGGS